MAPESWSKYTTSIHSYRSKKTEYLVTKKLSRNYLAIEMNQNQKSLRKEKKMSPFFNSVTSFEDLPYFLENM